MLKSSIWIAYCLSSVVCPSAVAFKQQHLWNHWASLNLTSPECSLHGPLTHLWNLLSSMQKSVCNCNQMVVIKALLFSNLLTDLKNNLEWMFLGWPLYKSKYILKLIFFSVKKYGHQTHSILGTLRELLRNCQFDLKRNWHKFF